MDIHVKHGYLTLDIADNPDELPITLLSVKSLAVCKPLISLPHEFVTFRTRQNDPCLANPLARLSHLTCPQAPSAAQAQQDQPSSPTPAPQAIFPRLIASPSFPASA